MHFVGQPIQDHLFALGGGNIEVAILVPPGIGDKE
jgi:hypothetical protein